MMSLAAQEQVKGSDELTVRTERVDDVVLLIGVMEQIGLRKVIDNHIPEHGNQRELSWGWTTVIWLAYIVSEGDHRKVSVQEYIKGMKESLSELTGQQIEELDFSDDRLTNLLRYLSKKETWELGNSQ
jgi:transposase